MPNVGVLFSADLVYIYWELAGMSWPATSPRMERVGGGGSSGVGAMGCGSSIEEGEPDGLAPNLVCG